MTVRMPVADRRRQLVDSALAVAVQDGIAAATVRRVAQQAGVALGVVHYCFADKDELFTELAARIVDDLAAAGTAQLNEALRRCTARPGLAAVLDAAVGGVWAGIERAPGAQLLTYEITTCALRQTELRGVAERQYEVSQRAVSTVLTLAAHTAGARWLRPVDELAGQVLAFIDGVTLRWLVDQDSAAARSRLASVVALLVGQAKVPRRRGTPAAAQP